METLYLNQGSIRDFSDIWYDWQSWIADFDWRKKNNKLLLKTSYLNRKQYSALDNRALSIAFSDKIWTYSLWLTIMHSRLWFNEEQQQQQIVYVNIIFKSKAIQRPCQQRFINWFLIEIELKLSLLVCDWQALLADYPMIEKENEKNFMPKGQEFMHKGINCSLI